MQDIIEKAIEGWKNLLLDLTKKNRLINCPFEGRYKTLELHYPKFDSLVQEYLIDGETMVFPWKHTLTDDHSEFLDDDDDDGVTDTQSKLSLDDYACLIDDRDILTKLSDRELRLKLKRLSDNAKLSQSERGVNILFVAVGFLRWYESENSDEPLFSPLILIPAALKRIGVSVDAKWKLEKQDSEIVHNQTLWERLKRDFQLNLSEIEIPEEGFQEYSEVKSFLDTLQKAISQETFTKRWRIERRCSLDNFNFQRMAMVRDLEENKEKIANHPICRLIAGDDTALDSIVREYDIIDVKQFDEKIHPKDMFSVLDADSSQQEAIQAVLNGESIILDGPPGTGKSQTIANIIAEMLARKKTILFVSEKAAALEVVKKRLDEVNLGDFCLDGHTLSSGGNREIVYALGRCLEISPEPYKSYQDNLERLHDVRQKLNDYPKSLHKKFGKLDISPHQAHGYLLEYKQDRSFQSRHDNPLSMERGKLIEMENYFRELANNPVTGHAKAHPWQGCLLSNAALESQQIKEDFIDLASELKQLNQVVNKLEESDVMPKDRSINSLRAAINHVKPFFENPNYVEIPTEWFCLPVEKVIPVLGQFPDLVKKCDDIVKALRKYGWDCEKYFDASRENEIENDFRFLEKSWEIPPQIKLRYKKAYPHTIFEELQTLQELSGEISGLIEKATAIAGFKIPEEFEVGTKPDSLRLQQIHDYSEWASLVCDIPILPISWFDPHSEEEVQNTIKKLSNLYEKSKSLRKQLSYIAPDSFRSENTKRIVRESDQFNSKWKRKFGLSRKWKKWWSEVSNFYKEDVPPLEQVFEDMELLEQYFDLQDKIQHHKKRNRHHLIPNVPNPKIQVLYGEIMEFRKKMVELFSPSSIIILEKILTDKEKKESFFPQAIKLHQAIGDLYSKIQATNQLFIIDQFTSTKNVTVKYEETTLTLYSRVLQALKKELDNRIKTIKQIMDNITVGLNLSHQDLQNLDEKVKTLSESIKQLYTLKGELDRSIDGGFPIDFKSPLLGNQIGVYLGLVGTYKNYHNRITTKNRLLATSRDIYEDVRSQVETVIVFYENPRSKGYQYWDRLKRVFPTDSKISVGIVLNDATLVQVIEWLEKRTADISKLDDWVRYKESVGNLEKLGLQNWVEELTEGDIAPTSADQAFLYSFYRDWIKAVHNQEPHLRSFSEATHTQRIKDFREYDKNSYQNARTRVRIALLNDASRPNQEKMRRALPSSDIGILREQLTKNKKSKFLPARQLFSKIPGLILQLKPCIMMSPLTVSTYLQQFKKTFDLVIFDEASQIRPHDAIGAIFRGSQLVVAGDNKQLPPTEFFGSSDGDDTNEEETDNESISDYESILDVCLAKLPRKRLRWHYRSQREGLIAFSNHHIYDGDLITFPSVMDEIDPAVKFDYVGDGYWISGSAGGYNPVEAQRVAELVFKHFSEHPDKTLGVITLNKKHREKVDNEIQKMRRSHPEMEHFFDDARENPFFNKYLEIVQGDERDCIILSTGYGRDQKDGVMRLRFGPLNLKGGERRLNVAITRARYNVTLVSSMRSYDLSRVTSVGASLLRAYLEYAETGTKSIETIAGGGVEYDSPFEEEVAKALKKSGFEVKSQVGCKGYSIDLVLVDPERPDRYVLGIECDGAMYHRSYTARDRDRLRQDVLESLGWTIHRIWSTDWVNNPDIQIEKVRKAYDLAKIKLENFEKSIPKSNARNENKPMVVSVPGTPYSGVFRIGR